MFIFLILEDKSCGDGDILYQEGRGYVNALAMELVIVFSSSPRPCCKVANLLVN